MTHQLTLEYFSDYVCPYCWLAESALKELQKETPGLKVIWRSFELRPDPFPTLDPHGEYLTKTWQELVYPLAERMGVEMHLPPVQPRSRLAHEAAHFAAAEGRFEAMNDEIFRAFFQRGEDISRIDVLVRLGSTVGLDGLKLEAALQSGQFTKSVISDHELARDLGASSVPAYLVNRKRMVTGARDLEDLRKIVDM